MRTAPLLTLLLSSAIAMSLTACGSSDDDELPVVPPAPVIPAPPAPLPEAGDTILLTVSNKLQSFNIDAPGTTRNTIAIVGMQAGENIVGIDYRPADGLLYGVGSGGRIYLLNPTTGAATLKSTLAADPTDTTAPFSGLSGTEFGVDFNPAADRLRIVSNTGQSLRINVDTGATTTDGSINRTGASPAVVAAAYTNSFAGTAATSLFVIDTVTDNLALQNPPNDGTLTNIGPIGIGVAAEAGMDIAGGGNGLVLASLRTNAGGPTTLYRIDLTTGAAVPVNGAANAALSTIGSGSLKVIDVAIVLK